MGGHRFCSGLSRKPFHFGFKFYPCPSVAIHGLHSLTGSNMLLFAGSTIDQQLEDRIHCSRKRQTWGRSPNLFDTWVMSKQINLGGRWVADCWWSQQIPVTALISQLIPSHNFFQRWLRYDLLPEKKAPPESKASPTVDDLEAPGSSWKTSHGQPVEGATRWFFTQPRRGCQSLVIQVLYTYTYMVTKLSAQCRYVM
jgi:hypothetical protein